MLTMIKLVWVGWKIKNMKFVVLDQAYSNIYGNWNSWNHLSQVFLLEHNFNIKENRIFFEGVIEWKRNILVWSLRANLLEAMMSFLKKEGYLILCSIILFYTLLYYLWSLHFLWSQIIQIGFYINLKTSQIIQIYRNYGSHR